jgi:EAL domain-containing protein (putative c-di-GMP-specific phosphodiesterase class I)
VHFLRRHGCDQVQGFLYGEPVPPAEFAQLLERARRRGKRA